MAAEDQAPVRAKALGLLARREHSRRELRTKLRTRGFSAAVVEMTVSALAEQGLQSDERFLEAFVAARIARGQGPRKIVAELSARGITGERVTATLEPHAPRWRDLARQVRERRFGTQTPAEARIRESQTRFLAQRGFTHEQIRAAFGTSAEE